MLKQMAWLSSNAADTDSAKILYLRTESNQPWQPYSTFPEYAVKDYDIEGVSLGFATFQKLFREGWSLVPSDQVSNHQISNNQEEQLSLFQSPDIQ